MKIFNIHSVITKIVMIVILLTILTIALFIMTVLYNQHSQGTEKSILNCQNTASKLKLRIERIAGASALSPEAINNRIIKEATSLEIGNLTLYGEKGNVLVHIVNGQLAPQPAASDRELATIIRVIARRGFEDMPNGMPYYYETDPQQKTIILWVPFAYGKDKNGVAVATLAPSAADDGVVYQCLAIGGLIVIVQALFAVLLFTMLLFPLRRLSKCAGQIAEGKMDARIPIVRNDEIGQVASALNEMSVALQRKHDETMVNNPLTGLPGNIAIFNYLNDCLANDDIMCALYCDLSNFRAYNDKYGFTKGDEVIIFMRDCLRLAAKKNNMGGVFIGHEGGDDFVAITGYEQWEIFAKSVVTFFDKGIHSFYNSTDARNGYIELVNRRGESRRVPLMSISVAVVTNKTRNFQSVAELISVAGEVRKYVKSREGSCYAIDRRTGRMPLAQTTAPSPSGT
jgi:GGDEF domain-containing protein